ncbi:MAG: hypothetical protein HDT21_10625 [Ruminococcus sp.]|nr:hypothetical protein [Ruminococcus sp.]
MEIYFVSHRKKGERSCPLPSKCYRISHPFHRFERYAPAGARGNFALCGARPKGSALWTSASWAQLDQLESAASPPKGLLFLRSAQKNYLCPLLFPFFFFAAKHILVKKER